MNYLQGTAILCDFIPSLLSLQRDGKGLFAFILWGQWAKGAYFKGKMGQEKCRN